MPTTECHSPSSHAAVGCQQCSRLAEERNELRRRVQELEWRLFCAKHPCERCAKPSSGRILCDGCRNSS
jgi:hypothetical protein